MRRCERKRGKKGGKKERREARQEYARDNKSKKKE